MKEKLRFAQLLERMGHQITECWDKSGNLRIYVDGEYMNLFRLRWFAKKGRVLR